MEIRIDSLKERPRKLVFDEPIEDFPVLCELATKEAIAFRSGVSAELVATLVGALVEVEGSLSFSIVLPCSRCLRETAQQIELSVALTFKRQSLAVEFVEEERELTEDEVGLILFEGECIDLRSPVEQELIMALPQHSLCRNDCAGLCPVCGADLNGGSCGCAPPQFHGALEALKKFKVEKN